MKHEDLIKYSITELREINSLKRELLILGESLNLAPEATLVDTLLTSFSAPPAFFFQVNHPTRDAKTKKGQYKIHYRPRSETNNDSYETVIEKEFIVKSIQHWAQLVQEFNNEVRIYTDPFYKQAEEEIENLFHFVKEDDDDTNCFSLVDQARIRNLLTYIECELKHENILTSDIEYVLEKSAELKEKVHLLPKSVTKVMITKIMVFFKKSGAKAFNKVIDELLKRSINFGLDEAQRFIGGFLSQ